MSVEVILVHLKCDIQLIIEEWGRRVGGGVNNAETRLLSGWVPNNVR